MKILFKRNTKNDIKTIEFNCMHFAEKKKKFRPDITSVTKYVTLRLRPF